MRGTVAKAKEKRLRERLAAIKDEAAQLAIDQVGVSVQDAANLAEEAAGLGLELADILEEAK